MVLETENTRLLNPNPSRLASSHLEQGKTLTPSKIMFRIGVNGEPIMFPKLVFGPVILMFRSVMFLYTAFSMGSHTEPSNHGRSGKQSEHGLGLHGLPLMACCAGPIQMGHCSAAKTSMFSNKTLRRYPDYLVIPHPRET